VTQLQGTTSQSVGYLDQLAKGWPGFLWVAAAVSLLVPEAQKLVLNRPLTVHTPHDLGGIWNAKGGLWLSESHLFKYQVQLLGGTEITLRTCQSLSPASLLPETWRGSWTLFWVGVYGKSCCQTWIDQSALRRARSRIIHWLQLLCQKWHQTCNVCSCDIILHPPIRSSSS
jgi:hypothetical protein